MKTRDSYYLIRNIVVKVSNMRDKMKDRIPYTKKGFFKKFFDYEPVDKEKLEACLLSIFEKLDDATKEELSKCDGLGKDNNEDRAFFYAYDFGACDVERLRGTIERINRYCKRKGEDFILDGTTPNVIIKKKRISIYFKKVEKIAELSANKTKEIEGYIKNDQTKKGKKVGDMAIGTTNKITHDANWALNMMNKAAGKDELELEGKIPKQIKQKKKIKK